MKRLDKDRRSYCVNVMTRRTARRRRRALLLGGVLRRKTGGRKAPTAKIAELLVAPAVFHLYTSEARGRVVRFIRQLREAALHRRARVFVDFSQTSKMEVSGTLLLAAELDRINAMTGDRPVSCGYPKDEVVAQVLQHVGIFEMLSQRRKPSITHDSVKYWKVHTGVNADGEKVEAAMSGYLHRFPDPKKKALYRALTEAMTNCRQHAYPAHLNEQVQNWWLFSQAKDGRLLVGFCDLGLGIPRSLQEKEPGIVQSIVDAILLRGQAVDDARLIQSAMTLGKSRTNDPHRGKGLMDMRAVVDGLNGTLQIHSGRGLYRYQAEKPESEPETCTNFDKSMQVGGTLIIWGLPLPEEAQSS